MLGSNPATRLTLIRCVGAIDGCKVTVINMVNSLPSHPSRTFDTFSKYVDGFYYAKKFDADGLAQLLLDKCCVEGEKPILMSVDDDSACLIDMIQDRLRENFSFSNIDYTVGAISSLMDKGRQKELAKKFGFNVVESWKVDYVDGKYVIPDGIRYPCYVKGLLSYHSAKKYQKRCDSKCELETWLEVIARNNPSPLLVEEFIEIEKEYGIIGYSDTKSVLLPAIVELIDSGHGAHKGVSVFGRVKDIGSNNLLIQQIERLIKNIRLSGQFNIDIVETKGRLYFVELNLRFAAYGYAVFKAGVNVPAFQVKKECNVNFEGAINKVLSGCCYVNEKVASDDIIGGYRTWKNYSELIHKSDCRMVYDQRDKKPYYMFLQLMLKNYMISMISRLLRLK